LLPPDVVAEVRVSTDCTYLQEQWDAAEAGHAGSAVGSIDERSYASWRVLVAERMARAVVEEGAPMSGRTAAEAEADAAAAKARAKAVRRWYRKKRWWIVGFLAVVVVASVTSSSGSGDDDEAGGVQSSSTNDENPPQDDVRIVSCERNSELTNVLDAELEIVNHSSKRSNYLMEITVEDGAGTKIGDAVASANNVEPDQTAREQAVGTITGNAAAITCRLASVDRFAS
jgi:hypothetical protein